MNRNMHYSLLDGSVISVRFRNGETSKTNLPEIFYGLMDDTIVSFEALQLHQQQAWYSFLVQLATMAVARKNDGEIPTNPDQWRRMLVDLAEGSEAAWHLVVDDPSKPAFMQSPVPEGSLDDANYGSLRKSPDELDMLVASKNHDLKMHRILHPEAEHWLFGLLTLQTMEGYSGRYHGISRMNGGGGNRPFVGFAPNLKWSGRFLRDLKVLLEYRNDLFDMYSNNGVALLWTHSWNGGKNDAIRLADCDPYYIEICRRVRFKNKDGKIICLSRITKDKRIDMPDSLNGVTRDPWTPIKKEGTKAYSATDSGFTYKVVQQILLGESFIKPKAIEFQNNEKSGVYMINKALVRGGGVKTETNGLHHRVVKITPKVSSIFLNKPSLKRKLAKRSTERVSLTSEVQKRILFPAISELIKSGTEQQIDYKKLAQKIDPWIGRFDSEIDHRFFESLWASVELDQTEATREWEKILFQEAEKIYKEAERSIPIAQLRRLRAVSYARSIFYSQAKTVFEYARKETTPTT